MKIICMIPARLDSKRFPRKIFAKLNNRTLLGNVIEAAKRVEVFDDIYVAACSKQVADEAHSHGVKSVITDPRLENGTYRIIDAIEKEDIKGDLFVNWQADEPFITPSIISRLLEGADSSDILTLKQKIEGDDIFSPSVVKVVTNLEGRALYFSRSVIPYHRNVGGDYFKHIGLYGYTKDAFKKIKTLEKGVLETVEVLEQLRWLEHGLNIHVTEVEESVIGIDTKEDLELAEKMYS